MLLIKDTIEELQEAIRIERRAIDEARFRWVNRLLSEKGSIAIDVLHPFSRTTMLWTPMTQHSFMRKLRKLGFVVSVQKEGGWTVSLPLSPGGE